MVLSGAHKRLPDPVRSHINKVLRDDYAPSLHARYRRFNATTGWCPRL